MGLNEQQRKFLENAAVKVEDFEKAQIDIQLLIDIADDYSRFSSDFLQEAEYIAKKLQRCKSVHSVRWRVKDVGHLVEKIVRKRCENKVSKKYLEISVENYKSVLTDLIGVRAIHLFKDEWNGVHQHILSNWKPIEKVVVYFRDGDNIDMFKGHSCKTVKHKAGYRSIHYIIPVSQIDNNKIACEIQTRTLFEEGWSEIDHRVRYPNFLNDENLKKYLDIFNRLAGSADEMGSYVNSLVELINLNSILEQAKNTITEDFETKIKNLEDKIGKLFAEKAKLEDIEKAYNELKEIYDEKDKINHSIHIEKLVNQDDSQITKNRPISTTILEQIFGKEFAKNLDAKSEITKQVSSIRPISTTFLEQTFGKGFTKNLEINEKITKQLGANQKLIKQVITNQYSLENLIEPFDLDMIKRDDLKK